MFGDRGVAAGRRVKPDFVATDCLPIKQKAQFVQATHEIAIPKSRKTAHEFNC